MTAGPAIYVPNSGRSLAERAADDFGLFAFEGFGIKLSDQQLEAQAEFGHFGPRARGDAKNYWLSGGQRAGKTVLAFLIHADACLYKRGVDNADRTYWKNYAYGTLAIAPIDQLAMRLYAVGAEIAKGSSDTQWNSLTRHARPAAFLSKLRVGKSGPWGIWRFSNGSFTDFRSSEGKAYRLEGGQWWGCTWDEWASQPDYEIEDVATDVLLGRLRDHDAKLLAMAWPKPETEHHLIKRIRDIAAGKDLDSKVIYLSAEAAYFTNKGALKIERRIKDDANWSRTVLGRPAGGAAIEFKGWMVENAKRPIPRQALPEEGYAYFQSVDVGLAHDATVSLTWRIPIVNGKRVVSNEHKARIVDFFELKGSAGLTLDTVTYRVAAQQQLYRAQTALDATSMGGTAAARQLQDMKPPPLSFISRSNDRVHGNMRLAAITNALELMTWGRVDESALALHHEDADWQPDEVDGEWGCVEFSEDLIELVDQLLSFDRDAKHIPDDRAWAFIIGLWYIRRFWVIGRRGLHVPRTFDVRAGSLKGSRRGARRARLIAVPGTPTAVDVPSVTAGPMVIRGPRY